MGSQSDIKLFIDFFHDASLRVRNKKPIFIRGKDGKLVKLALSIFSRPQLEMLAVWFLAKKQKLAPSIGTMLSRAVIEELKRKIIDPSFWKELDAIYETRYQQPDWKKELRDRKQAFTSRELMEFQSKL